MSLPADRGTLTNLATSKQSPAANKVITIPLDRSVEPYYFKPMS